MPDNKTQSDPHPRPLDKNRAILWARHLAQSDDWLILSTRVTDTANAQAKSAAGQVWQEPSMLVSVAVLTPAGTPAVEALIRPPGSVSSTDIAAHGIEFLGVFNVTEYEQLRERLSQLLPGKQVISWELDKQVRIISQLDEQYGQQHVRLSGHSVAPQYARFTGAFNQETGHYSHLPLPNSDKAHSAMNECRTILSLISQMAASTQQLDGAATKQGWTGEFFKPRVSPVEKVKEFFGLDSN